MDIAGALLLQRQLEGMGFHFFLGTKTQKIEPDERELRVSLEGGERLTAELILISAGVRPEIYLNKFLNLPIGTGVKVDDHMRTGIDGIYAAGDLIEHRGRYYGSWTAAMEQGRVAGANMAGRDTAYEGTISSNTLKVAGIDLVAAGDIDGEGKREAAVIKNEDKKTYRKVVFEGDTIIGAIFFGNIRGNEQIQKAIKLRKNISPWKHELGKEGFDFTQLD
jgi:nitrite reductase (NADH) large subunit